MLATQTRRDITREALVSGLLLRAGIEPLKPMDPELGERFESMPALDFCREALRFSGQEPSENPYETTRAAVSTNAVADIFSSAISTAVLKTFLALGDTTRGWCHEMNLTTFSATETKYLKNADSLERVPRGGTASHASIVGDKSTWRLARYAKQLIVDEQDIIDDQVSAAILSAQELARAARRLRPDLVYSLLLENPEIDSDGIACFHAASHENLATSGSALAAGSLATGIASMGNQVREDTAGREVHLGIRPKFLICPPSLEDTAARLLHLRTTGKKSDITLVSESRIGSKSVWNPKDGTSQTGSTTNWFLGADAVESPSVLVGYFSGNRTPDVRRFQLERGQWGMGWDIKMDICAKIADFRALYRATGEA